MNNLIKFPGKNWICLALCIFTIISAAAIFWIKDNPFAYDGDEGEFIDTAYQDFHSVKDTSFIHFMRTDYRYRLTAYAPAFRLLALPGTLTFGPSILILRISSWICFSLTLLFIFLTVKNLSKDEASGALAVIFLTLCPMLIFVSKLLMTEPSLHLALAMMFYFCFKDWDHPQGRLGGWLGLGIALGLGILAKLSFILIALPVILMMLGIKYAIKTEGLSLSYLFKALLIGVFLAFDWYRNNLNDYVSLLSQVTTQNIRHSFGIHLGFIEKLKMGFIVFTESETGPYLWGITILLMLFILIRYKSLDKKIKLALVLCFLSMVPTLFAFFGGINNNSRYLSPILIPLSIAYGLMGGEVIKRLNLFSKIILAGVMCFQLLVIITPSIRGLHLNSEGSIADSLLNGNATTVFEREDQWDWDTLRKICNQKHLKNPSIRYLGNGLQLKSYLIKFPWAKHHEKADVDWRIWQYEQGPINWDKIFKIINNKDVVLTAPKLIGYKPNGDDLDNRHNAEFVKRLKADPNFEGPIILSIGRFEPEEVDVFLKKKPG